MSRLPTPQRLETDLVARHLGLLREVIDWSRVIERATPWVEAVRRNPPPFWAMESLLREYPLSRPEGLALMRLAEALLRVPDAATAIELTADQLQRADFTAGHDSALGRLSASVLSLAKKTLPESGEPAGLLSRIGAQTTVAATVRAVQLLARQFVLGETIEAAVRKAEQERQAEPRWLFSYDMLGEGARTRADAERYLAAYRHALEHLAQQARERGESDPRRKDGLSVKLSALHPRFERVQQAHCLPELEARLLPMVEQAAVAGLNLTLDAEESERLEISLDVFERLLGFVSREHPNWTGLGLAIQAYQTRAVEWVEHVTELARRYGVRLMCRLVKGAYWDSEVKRAQELGLEHYPVYTCKTHSDVSYLACAERLLAAQDVIYPQFATHNAATIAAIEQLAARYQARFEWQRLHGMGSGIYREYLQDEPQARAVRVYAPVGSHRDLLAYLVRRLLENGANSSFVHQLVDPAVPVESLLADPRRVESLWLPRPREILAPRRIAAGFDLSDDAVRACLQQALQVCALSTPRPSTATELEQAIGCARDAFPKWRDTPIEARVTPLRRAADRVEEDWASWCARLVREGRKGWADALAEVRETIDFLRYYADEAERIGAEIRLPGPTGEDNRLRLRGRGVWAAISPWNFPLAIFTGQIAAALATGNTVVAKPAEQTPAVAQAMVELLHACGIPEPVLHLVIGEGPSIGAPLVAHPSIAGVVFTGSTAVAKTIQRALAAKEGPIVPLIAETGGINAMIVDSTALPEHVVDAVVQSAFRSAGQRCSALRLLCLHEAVAESILDMLSGALACLRVGDPADFAIDVGPLIDQEAWRTVETQLQRLRARGRLRAIATAVDPTVPQACPPQIFEIEAVADVDAEIFAPVLQVLRWSGDPQPLLERINALGYGLTFGVQTRIDHRAEALARASYAGNVYINRSMIGAVVGVQPFGGEGLSGTGPKAGGPHYLYRFCSEQTITINTAAAGGNVALLAG